jgi:hypothetical protein
MSTILSITSNSLNNNNSNNNNNNTTTTTISTPSYISNRPLGPWQCMQAT